MGEQFASRGRSAARSSQAHRKRYGQRQRLDPRVSLIPYKSYQHEAYLRSHWVIFCFVIAIAVSGFLQIFLPGTVADSAVSNALPQWLKTIFSAVYLVAGILSLIGLLVFKPKFEAAGASLIASVLSVQFGATIYLFGFRIVGSSIIVALLAVGFWLRSRALAQYGYN